MQVGQAPESPGQGRGLAVDGSGSLLCLADRSKP